MKVSIFSDLHLEGNRFNPRMFERAGALSDAIVLAGDIVDTQSYYMLGAIRSLVPSHVPIMFTPGNHEYYLSSGVKKHRSKLREYCKKNNIVFLDRSTFEFHGYLFIGCTGWSDMQAYATEVRYFGDDGSVESMISDFRLIGDWSISKMVVQSGRDRHFIKKSIKTADMKKLKPFVVTHFPPLESLNSGRYPLNSLSPFFVNEWSDLVRMVDGVWVYGHTHYNRPPIKVGNALMISNQHGYRNECYGTFDPSFVMDLEKECEVSMKATMPPEILNMVRSYRETSFTDFESTWVTK